MTEPNKKEVSPNYEKWLVDFQKFLDESPKEQIDEIMAKVDAMGITGPTVEEYSDAVNGHPNKIAALQSRIAELESHIKELETKLENYKNYCQRNDLGGL